MHSIGFEPYMLYHASHFGGIVRENFATEYREMIFFARWIFVIQNEMTSLMIALSNSIQLILLPIFVSLSILKLFHMTMRNHCARPFRSLIK